MVVLIPGMIYEEATKVRKHDAAASALVVEIAKLVDSLLAVLHSPWYHSGSEHAVEQEEDED